MRQDGPLRPAVMESLPVRGQELSLVHSLVGFATSLLLSLTHF